MPPKPVKANQPSKKTEAKKKEKVVEDKTFGLKNKKGSKQQKFIQQVQKQVHAPGNKTAKQLEKEKEDLKKKKEDEKKKIMEITNLFKPVQQIAAKGVDPKSILCAYFKQGLCAKGTKCKFSHDLNIERKGEKRSAYVDMRDENETSANWDEATLLEVVEKKLAKENRNMPTTEIICRFFLDAVEEGKYGWFWECPNGEKCIYRHALPPGYVLKKDRKGKDKDREEISLEDLIERQRAALGFNTTKVTLETFLAWKKKKLKEREEQIKKDTDKKKSDYKSGKDSGISGREMFTFNPDLAIDEYDAEEGDAEFDFGNIKKDVEDGEEDQEEEIHYREINFSSLIDEYEDVDSTGGKLSVAAPDRMDVLRQELSIKEIKDLADSEKKALVNGSTDAENCEGAVAIDEDLFGGDDEDLDELEDELEELNVNS